MAAGHVSAYALFKSKDLKCTGHLKTSGNRRSVECVGRFSVSFILIDFVSRNSNCWNRVFIILLFLILLICQVIHNVFPVEYQSCVASPIAFANRFHFYYLEKRPWEKISHNGRFLLHLASCGQFQVKFGFWLWFKNRQAVRVKYNCRNWGSNFRLLGIRNEKCIYLSKRCGPWSAVG